MYARNFWAFVLIAASVQLPVYLLRAAVFHLIGGGLPFFTISVGLGVLGAVLLYSVGARCVGLQYATGRVSPASACRIGLRRSVNVFVASVVAFAAASTAAFALMTAATAVFGSSWSGLVATAVLFVLATPLAVAAYVVWTSAVQVAVVEGRPAPAIASRLIAVVAGQLPRLTMIAFVAIFVAFGLSVIITTPFALAMWLLDVDPAQTGVTLAVQSLAAITVGALVFPVLTVASSLLYYDARVRKESFTIEDLSQELGLAGD